MPVVPACEQPAIALLARYSHLRGCCTDGYSAEVGRGVDLPEYAAAFNCSGPAANLNPPINPGNSGRISALPRQCVTTY